MAFTGVAVVEKIADQLVRITGLSLAASAAGTIGLFGDATADVELPADFDPRAYGDVSLVDSLQLNWQIIAAGAAVTDLAVAKAAGPPFQFTVTNNDGGNATAELEIYVRFH